MQRILLLCLLLCHWGGVFAQYNEFGLLYAGANPITDIGKAAHIAPNKQAWGMLYKFNMHPRYSFRSDVRWLTLADNDQHSQILARQKRGYSFENKITELSLGVEYNFLEFDQHRVFDYLFTPYINVGIVYFRQDNLHFPQASKVGQKAVRKGTSWDWALPFSVGVKTRLGYTPILFGAEMGIRYTFTHNLDGSYPPQTSLRLGNNNNRDWYFVAGFYISYSFGKKRCLCF